jgi:hypothetical protein
VARKAAKAVREATFEEHQRLLLAMFEMAQNYQVHPVYPSDTAGKMEWHDSTPESDREFPKLPDDQWNELYYND